jgi:hypothetical protein
LHIAHPFGAKLKLMILISERNGSAMVFYSIEKRRYCFANRSGRRVAFGKTAVGDLERSNLIVQSLIFVLDLFT